MADDDKRTADEPQRQGYEAQYKPLAADAEEKRLAQAEEERKKREEGDEERKKQARETPLVADAAGNVMIEAIMGPYRGNRLTVTEAEGQAAINDHWARNPVITEYQHEELSEEDRTAAWEAANTWAKETWEKAGQVEGETPPPEAEAKRREQEEAERQRQQQRDMQPDQAAGYKTRQSPTEPPRRR